MQDISSDEEEEEEGHNNDDDVQYQNPYSARADTGSVDEENTDVSMTDMITGPAVTVARSIRKG